MHNPITAAASPPPGWNSWDCYGMTVTEAEVLANSQLIAGSVLQHGWNTVVVDIRWYEPAARAGRYNADARWNWMPTVDRPQTPDVSLQQPTGVASRRWPSECTRSDCLLLRVDEPERLAG